MGIIDKIRKHGIGGSARIVLERIFIRPATRAYFIEPVLHSYSQKQEDLAIDRLLGYPKTGFYVDVGAHDPNVISNTKRFYEKGWHGINIEPNSALHQQFVAQRNRDINLNIGVGPKEGQMSFYQFDPAAVSTFSKSEADEYVQKMHYKLVQTVPVSVRTLASVMAEHAKGPVDFLSVDTEGLDLDVLKSNDWARFRPRLVCVESVHHADSSEYPEIRQFMESVGYARVYFNGLNAIYQDQKSV